MVFIYVLKLSHNKFYIGKTSNPNIRIQNHFSQNMKAAIWTKLYKPIEIVELISNCDEYDEEKYTLKYMDIYGIESVRGGYFSYPVLTSTQIYFIKQMLRSINNKCLHCGLKDHFIKECPNKNIKKLNDQIPIKTTDQIPINYFFNLLEQFIYPDLE